MSQPGTAPDDALDPTRRQLDELELLLQRMLEIPAIKVDGPPAEVSLDLGPELVVARPPALARVEAATPGDNPLSTAVAPAREDSATNREREAAAELTAFAVAENADPSATAAVFTASEPPDPAAGDAPVLPEPIADTSDSRRNPGRRRGRKRLAALAREALGIAGIVMWLAACAWGAAEWAGWTG